METQEMFDTVVTHLLTQKVRSYGPPPSAAKYNVLGLSSAFCCLYRDPEGRKCAAGCLLPDEKYTTNMENVSVDGIKWFQEEFTQEQLKLLRILQVVHDTNDPSEWEVSLRGKSESFGLKFNWVPPSEPSV